MTDARQRRLSRDPEAQTLPERVAALRAMQRAGDVGEAVLKIRAYCGDAAAREVVGGAAHCGAIHHIGERCGDLATFPAWLDGLLGLAPARWVEKEAGTFAYWPRVLDDEERRAFLLGFMRENIGAQWLSCLAAVAAAARLTSEAEVRAAICARVLEEYPL